MDKIKNSDAKFSKNFEPIIKYMRENCDSE